MCTYIFIYKILKTWGYIILEIRKRSLKKDVIFTFKLNNLLFGFIYFFVTTFKHEKHINRFNEKLLFQ
jgi:hypothetical protein